LAPRVAWGIDIGEAAIKAVKVRRSGDSAVVMEYHTVLCGGRAEEAQSGDRDFRVRNALSELLYQVDMGGARIAVSLPGRDVFPRFILLPPVEKRRIPEVVRYEARTQMPFPIEEVVWDYQPVSGVGVPGEELEVAFFAAKKATVYSFLMNLRLARLVPDMVEITPLALYNFLAYDRTFEAGTVVIDVGAANTDLVIIDGERFWTRSVAISGNDITRALQEKYQISFEEAENLKQKAATSKQAEKIFGAMRPIVDDLIGEVQRSIGYYKAHARNVKIDRVILLGNSFKLPQLVEYFRKGLDYEVSMLDTLEKVRVSSGMNAERLEAELPSYGVALGLAIQALGLGRVNIDLIPRELVTERQLRQKLPYAAAALFLLALPLLVNYYAASVEIGRCAEEIEPIEKQIKIDQGRLTTEANIAKLGKTGDDLAPVARVGRGRADWARFFDDLNLAVNQLKREPFRLNSVRELSDVELRGGVVGGEGLGKVGLKPLEPRTPGTITIEVRFEKDLMFEAVEVSQLGDLLKERVPRVIKVEGREMTELKGEGATEKAVTGWAYTFWVTYHARPGEAVAPPVEAPKEAPKAPPPKRTVTKKPLPTKRGGE